MDASRKSSSLKYIAALVAALAIGLVAGVFISRRTAAPEQAAQEKQTTLYSCPMHPEVIQDHPGDCPICGMHLQPVSKGGAQAASSDKTPAGERKVLYWVAPMDPTYISDKPGKSPMGMDLVPVYEGQEPAGGGVLKIDPQVVQNIGVRTAEVKSGKLTHELKAVATFEPNEETLAVINTKIGGWIEKLYVNETGQEVKKGEPLLTIYSPQLVSTQEEYLAALKYMRSVKDSPYKDVADSGRELLAASRKRLAYWDISEAQIKELGRTGRIRKNLTLYSPVNGVVMEKKAVEGAKVMEGMSLFKIADLDTLWLQARFYEQDAPWVRVGDHAQVQVDYLSGDTFSGRVSFIYPYLNSKTRDITARIVVENHGLELKPGMYATITFERETDNDVVYIPDEAVIMTGLRNLVFVDLGEGKFAPREVTLGLYGDSRMVEIKSGLHPGEKVVTSGEFLLDSESRMEEAVNKMIQAQKEKKEEPAPAEGAEASAPTQKMDMSGMSGQGSGSKSEMDMSGMSGQGSGSKSKMDMQGEGGE